MISYKPFYETLDKKHISQYQLITEYLVPSGTIDRIRKNQNLTLKSIEQLCNILKCKINDVVMFV